MKFIITERRPQVFVYTYEVEAENEQEAFEIVWNCNIEPVNYQTEEIDYDEVDYDIRECAL
jgi:hypothetical protein